ncbi:MAG: polyhydroxyalkanoate synthesis regulator DNA-binding domain-containing protein [Ardenticatenaceae bacterium]
MRTIKRYSNRKLYDTEEKRYITLEGVAELIREGHDVEVTDNDTGEDLTAVTLSQIIFEQQKRGAHAPLGFLTNLIRFDNLSPFELLRRSFLLPGTAFNAIEKEIERRLEELVEQGEMAEEQMRRLQADLLARFYEGGRKARDRVRDAEGPPVGRFTIPTHGDMQELAERLDSLTARLDELIALTRAGKERGVGEPDMPPGDETTQE